MKDYGKEKKESVGLGGKMGHESGARDEKVRKTEEAEGTSKEELERKGLRRSIYGREKVR